MTHIVDERYTTYPDGRLLNAENLLRGREETEERIWRQRRARAGRADLSHRMHAAWDIPGPEGTPVRAVLDGEVVWAGMIAGYGHTVILLHRTPPSTEPAGGDRPLTTAYCHMDGEDVAQGAQVRAGDQVGRLGGTNWDRLGRVGGVVAPIVPHLHFSVQLVEPHPDRSFADRWRDPVTGWQPAPRRSPVRMMGEYTDGNLVVRTARRFIRVDGERVEVQLNRGFYSDYEEDWSRQVEPVRWLREIYGESWLEYRTALGPREDHETEEERHAAARARARRLADAAP